MNNFFYSRQCFFSITDRRAEQTTETNLQIEHEIVAEGLNLGLQEVAREELEPGTESDGLITRLGHTVSSVINMKCQCRKEDKTHF